MSNTTTDIGSISLNKKGEQLCGDRVEVRQSEIGDGSTTLVLADGLGSGVKANILSTLTSKIIATMMANGMDVEDCVATMASTLPVCNQRQVAYSTFTIIKTTVDDKVILIQYDNPDVIFLRDNKHIDYSKKELAIEGKKIFVSEVCAHPGDVFIAMSDGAIYAGVGQTLNFGWQRNDIIAFLESRNSSDFSAKIIAMLIADQCNELYNHMPGDDTTVAVVKIRSRETLNVMIGPPRDKNDDEKSAKIFLESAGKHVVCGGTTSTIVAKYLGQKIDTTLDYIDKSIPPTAKIQGIDLVTEGIITASKALSYAQDFANQNILSAPWLGKKDGASRLCQAMFEEATDVNFFVGKAINPAHQNPDLPINFGIKIKLIQDMISCLDQCGKRTTVVYF